MTTKLVKPVLRGRLLKHQTEGIPSPIVLPFGSVLTVNNHDFYATIHGNEIKSLIAKSLINESQFEILPAYNEMVVINTKKYGEIKFSLWEIIQDTDRHEAYNIILRSHYMNAPVRGLILGIKFVNTDMQQIILNSNKSLQPHPWSPAWNEKTGSMVGCVVLDQLIYANPKGRKIIAEELKCHELLEGQWYKQKRDEVLDKLKIAWISRLAIDAPYRNLGLGAILADKIAKVAIAKRIPSAKYVEVFTTLPNKQAKEIMEDPKKGFFSRADFKLFHELLPAKELLQPDKFGNRIYPEPAKKLYFYRKTDVN